MYSIHVIVVSDTCFKDSSKDKVIPILKDVIKDTSNFEILSSSIVPDEKIHIQSEIISKVQDGIDLIITAGGTGFSARDITPEAVESILERKAPGLVQLMIQESLKITPMAVLSRPVAGTIGDTIVVTLPGSPKGSNENLLSLLPVLPHAIDLIKGVTRSSLHSDTPPQSGEHYHSHAQSHSHSHPHSHSHSHDHHSHSHTHIGPKFFKSNDLSRPVTERSRSSPYSMVSVEDALEMIKKVVPTPTIEERFINDDLIGYIISEDIYSPINIPGYRTSIVDGYAVGDYEFPGSFTVINISHANLNLPSELPANTIVRVTTGAPIPNGTFAVIPVENTIVEKTKIVDEEEEEDVILINIDGGVEEGDNIRELGSDVRQGDKAITAGTEITIIGGEIGILASIGYNRVNVYRKPIIGIMSTGDEVVDAGNDPLIGGQIYDSNRPSLISACKGWNLTVIDLGIVKDKKKDIENSIKKAYEKVDLLITTGGVSMGELDLLKPTIERSLNGTIHFGRVAMKPGKPTTFGSFEKGIIFALPGNPASALVTFHLFVLPSIRLWSGKKQNEFTLPTIKVKLNEAINLDPRPEYHRVSITQNEQGILTAHSTGMQRSSRIGSMVLSTGLLCLPSSSKTKHKLQKGDYVDCIIMKI